MKAPALLTLLLPLRLLFVLVGVAAPAGAAEPLGRGVALGLFAEDPGWSYRPLLDEIRQLGADHVELVVAWYQRDVSAVEIGAHPRFTAPDGAVARAIRDARAAGLKVMVFPIVRVELQRSPDDWRGTLRPRDRAAWFRSYRRQLLRLARLAAGAGALALSLGSELSTLDVEPDGWTSLAADVRRVFRGPLIYSGNWDHFERVAIYDLVDYAGVCAYFALAEREDARRRAVPVAELAGRWQELRARLEQFARAVHRPLLLTEVGYLSQRGAAAWPWQEGAAEPVDLEEQRRCYQAFRIVWQEPSPLLAGVYFWNWYGWGGPTSRGYTPRGKPAAEEIKHFFAGRTPHVERRE